MAYKVETFGSWKGTLHIEGEQQFTSDGTQNFTVNTKKNLPYIFAEVRQTDERFPFQIAVHGQDSCARGQEEKDVQSSRSQV